MERGKEGIYLMKRKGMTKVLAVSMIMSLSISSLAFAGEWKKNDIGWWWENDDGSCPVNSWEWLDGNHDGIAECYYFGDQGYMLENTTVGEFTVNADGAWTVDGVVQVKVVAYDDVQNQDKQSSNVQNQEEPSPNTQNQEKQSPNAQSPNVQAQEKQSPNEGNDIQQNFDLTEDGDEEGREEDSLREQLDAIQDELYEVQYASKEKKQEVLNRYFELLEVNPEGLIIEEGDIRYFALGDSRSARFFTHPDVLKAIVLYMNERKQGVNTIYTSEGNYSYPAYLIMKTREAADAYEKVEW